MLKRLSALFLAAHIQSFYLHARTSRNPADAPSQFGEGKAKKYQDQRCLDTAAKGAIKPPAARHLK